MDPNTTLMEALALARTLVERHDHTDSLGYDDVADRLATALLSLDAWIVRSGVLPARWTPRQERQYGRSRR